MTRRKMMLWAFACGMLGSTEISVAQGPLKKLAESANDSVPRRPNDQIEGAIWQYKATPQTTDSQKKKDEPESKSIAGRFRVDGKAVFDVKKERSRLDPKERLEAIKKGKDVVSTPEPQQTKRIGDITKLDDGKTRIDFVEYEPLKGLAVVWPKKDYKDVWIGYFQEKDKAGKPTRKWNFELRKAED